MNLPKNDGGLPETKEKKAMGRGSLTGPGGSCFDLCGRLGDMKCLRCNTWFCQSCYPSHSCTSRFSENAKMKKKPKHPQQVARPLDTSTSHFQCRDKLLKGHFVVVPFEEPRKVKRHPKRKRR